MTIENDLLGELFQREANFKMTAILYKGSAPALTDLLGGVVDLLLDFAVSMKPQMKAGKLRALAVSGDKRLPSLPDVKTIAEQGHPNVVSTAWAIVVAPTGPPQDIFDKLADGFEKAFC